MGRRLGCAAQLHGFTVPIFFCFSDQCIDLQGLGSRKRVVFGAFWHILARYCALKVVFGHLRCGQPRFAPCVGSCSPTLAAQGWGTRQRCVFWGPPVEKGGGGGTSCCIYSTWRNAQAEKRRSSEAQCRRVCRPRFHLCLPIKMA